MAKLYHGSIKGYLDLAQQHGELRPFKPKEISGFIDHIAPLFEGRDEWLDDRLRNFQSADGVVYLAKSKQNAAYYATFYPEIVYTCTNRLIDLIEKNEVKTMRVQGIVPYLQNLHTYFQENGKPVVLTLELPEGLLARKAHAQENMLLNPADLNTALIATENVVGTHLFFDRYDRIRRVIEQKGIKF